MDEIRQERYEGEQRVQFPFVGGDVALRVKDIIYVVTNRHKNIFHTSERDYGIYKKLDEIESELCGYGFVRIHQSYLVNMQYVEKISSYLMRLTTGEELSVPKSRYQHVKREYGLYQKENLRMEDESRKE